MILLRRLLASFGVAFMVILGTGTMAAASESGGAVVASSQPNLDPEVGYEQAEGPSGNACGVGGGEAEINEAQELLSVNRWSNIVSHFPNNPDTGITNLDVLVGETSTQMFGGLVFGLSSAMWSMNTAVTSLAINFCPIDVIGGQIDRFVGTLGTVILSGGAPLIAGVVVMVVISVLWKMRRGGMAPLKQILVKTAAVAGLIVMTAGAANSWTEANQHQDAAWDPPWYSPGGMIVEMNNVASGISSGSVEWMMDSMFAETGALVPREERVGSSHCHWMIEAGNERYNEIVGPGAGLVSGLSQTWVGTTYMAWTRALFGDEYSVATSDPARDLPHHYIPCRIAEWHADIPNSVGDLNQTDNEASFRVAKNHYLADAFYEAGAMDEWSPSTFSPRDSGSSPALQINNNNDMYWSLIAGMCFDPSFDSNGNMHEMTRNADTNREVDRVWHATNGLRTFADLHDDNTDGTYAEICGSFWTWHENPDDNPMLDTSFQIHGDRSQYTSNFENNADNPSSSGQVAMVNFLTSANIGGVTFEGIGSMMASASVLVLMIPILIVLALVRLMMVMMMIGLFLSLLTALLPNQNFEAFIKTLKMTVGIILLSVFVQVIFAVIMGIMLMLNDMGAEALGTGGIIYAFWTAVTPWLAALGVHLTFKFLKLPSPLKLGAAMEWGNAMAKQGADSMGTKAGSMTGGGSGAAEGSKGMADKLRKRKSETDGSDSRGSGSDRQASQEETTSRKGSQRGVLSRVSSGASKAKAQTSKELGGNEATATARKDAKSVREKFASASTSKKETQRQQLDAAKDVASGEKRSLAQQAKGHRQTINALSGKANLNEDEQAALQHAQRSLAETGKKKRATADGVKALKRDQKGELKDLSAERQQAIKEAKAPAQGARTAALGSTWAGRKEALSAAAATTGSWANERRKQLGLASGEKGREQRKQNLRAMREGLRNAPGAARRGITDATKAVPGAALRAAAGANKSENLDTKALAGRAAKNSAVIGGLGATAMLGGAPLAAMGGAAVLGAGTLGARRAWNTTTSKNEGSVRSRVGAATDQVRQSLDSARRDPSVEPRGLGGDFGDPSGDQGPDSGGPSGPTGDTKPDSGGDSGGSAEAQPTRSAPADDTPRRGSSVESRDLGALSGDQGPGSGGPSGPTGDTKPDSGGDSGGSAEAQPTRSAPADDTPRRGSSSPEEGSQAREEPQVDTGGKGLGGMAAAAIGAGMAAKSATEKLGDVVEETSPVDDAATLEAQREDKKFREAIQGTNPASQPAADVTDSREYSLDDKGAPPPMPPEAESGPFADDPGVHRSGEDFAERMRRLRRR